MSGEQKVTAYQSFEEVTGRLDQIVTTVRDKDTSLERSLDLFDEAIKLGSRAVDLVDKVDFSPEELARMSDAKGETPDSDAGADDAEGPVTASEPAAPDAEATPEAAPDDASGKTPTEG
ncbi:MAG: exodeoxyribonuclease VII small subunit [Atopobiaceae bacterium]|jgi:exodeoxyribonuclease VII small subunit|nr:exodeoxyribonuclease VII small subunit [Atopobiaceae bacterium]MCH4180458.1 exodeoxyribonuclease VII small subunit [Atopobiaceae bacterium]MCH4214587.1 exodeoxyribonuclease VII small subunit [Atopobiaceae bacterium]MCH4229503.1 exodeoxyribonuclease VII small subunit [Atopobiaceae bacterium]MCH4275818.1 exodeoxyribonuclease VII small subunit [Atopobiaceae bacterium]